MQTVITLDMGEFDPFPLAPSPPRAAQSAALPPIVHFGMEKGVTFSEGNQAEGEAVSGQYIRATFEFHQIVKSMEETNPANSVILDKLGMKKTKKKNK